MDSYTKENYIKALYFLHLQNEEISLSDLGKELQVSKPTANDMVKKLQQEGIVISPKYKPIKITEEGKKKAAGIIRKHRLSEMFLAQIMNFGWEEVHDIAEELEHMKTEQFFDRMDELLGFPTTDPHGSPIPDKNGHFHKLNFKRLSQIPVHTTVVIKALKDSTSDFLLYLNKKQIRLETVITVHTIEPFDGTCTVSYDEFKDVVLTKAICDKLLVSIEK